MQTSKSESKKLSKKCQTKRRRYQECKIYKKNINQSVSFDRKNERRKQIRRTIEIDKIMHNTKKYLNIHANQSISSDQKINKELKQYHTKEENCFFFVHYINSKY